MDNYSKHMDTTNGEATSKLNKEPALHQEGTINPFVPNPETSDIPRVRDGKPISFADLAQKTDAPVEYVRPLFDHLIAPTVITQPPPPLEVLPPLPGPFITGNPFNLLPGQEENDLEPCQVAESDRLHETLQNTTSPIALPPPDPASPMGPAIPMQSVIERTVERPDASFSPPLDAIPNHQPESGSSSIEPKNNNEDSSKIPKQDRPNQSSRNYDMMSLVDLQNEFRQVEVLITRNRERRARVERNLNDLARHAKGKNIELDPEFREKKEEQKKCESHARYYSDKLEQISKKLKIRFNVNMGTLKKSMSNSHSHKRAKMSTGTPAPSSLAKPTDEKLNRLSLNLRDDFIWCKECEDPYKNLLDFCDHLHQSKHFRLRKKIQPWRQNRLLADTTKTYDMIKSICSRVSNELRQQLTILDLDNVLNGGLKDESLLKCRSIARERRNFQPDDTLFKFKGYDHLIPIRGFYCQLCSKALCDTREAEQHIRSFCHNYAHAKSVQLNPDYEINFRAKIQRARSAMEESEQPAARSKAASDTSQSNRLAQGKTTALGGPKPSDTPKPPAQYKKKTSHIVDQHENCMEKFDTVILPATAPRPTINLPVPPTRSTTVVINEEDEQEADSAAHQVRTTLPQIIPLGDHSRTQTAALKRLKRTNIDDRPPKRVAVSGHEQTAGESTNQDDEISDLEEDIDLSLDDNVVVDDYATNRSPQSDDDYVAAIESPEQYVEEEFYGMRQGDPDSPFPELEISLNGNARLEMLKDPRLKNGCHVMLNRINLVDYEHMLNDSTNLWSRVFALAMKKEDHSTKGLSDRASDPATKVSYFTRKGPVEVMMDGGEDDKEAKEDKVESESSRKEKLANDGEPKFYHAARKRKPLPNSVSGKVVDKEDERGNKEEHESQEEEGDEDGKGDEEDEKEKLKRKVPEKEEDKRSDNGNVDEPGDDIRLDKLVAKLDKAASGFSDSSDDEQDNKQNGGNGSKDSVMNLLVDFFVQKK